MIRTVVVSLAALAAMIAVASEASAQYGRNTGGPATGPPFSRVPPRPMPPPSRPDWGRPRPGYPSVIVTHPPRGYPPTVYEPAIERRAAQRPQQQQRAGGGAPPAGERRFVQQEVMIGLTSMPSPQAIAALLRRNRLTEIERTTLQISGTTWLRLRIAGQRSVASVVRALEADRTIAFVQPNYLFRLAQSATLASAPADGPLTTYATEKLRLPLAHALARGERITVAVIDSGIDAAHPELAGTITGQFNALTSPSKPDGHGTGIAGVIAGHSRLQGIAPAASILAVRAFDGSEGTSLSIMKGIDWAAGNGARVINMSFAGPSDPGVSRTLAAARKQGIVLIAAAGNAWPKSPPLYPAADPNVIAVTATDADDKLYAASNRGRYVALAAPGVDIVAPGLEATYQVGSGTSFAAAKVSGVVALMLQRKASRTPDEVAATLRATAKDLGPKGIDDQFGAGLTDAYAAVTAGEPVTAAER
jgi:hypothetical protein